MLSENIIKHLNDQLNAEFYSSNVYLQMSAWADYKGFPGAAKFLKSHAAEEMEHMQRLFTYLCETGAMPRQRGCRPRRCSTAGSKAPRLARVSVAPPLKSGAFLKARGAGHGLKACSQSVRSSERR